MASIAAFLARIIARHPRWLAVSCLLLAMMCAAILGTRGNFDTDVLNLLPGDRASVQGLKVMNSRFAQSRELTFVVQGATAGEAEALHSDLAASLEDAPWVVRMLDAPPIESDRGRADLQNLLVPLLLNLPPDDFQAAIAALDPDSLGQRFLRLRRGWDAGAPSAMVELSEDPLGLLALAVQPVWESASTAKSMDMVSPDGLTRLLPVVTNQPTLSADDSRAMMQQVHAFIEEVLADSQGDVSLEVTGRSAYVDEISTSMKWDIQLTAVVSLLAVTGLFWASFRQVLPLIGLAVLLSLSALAALTIGSVVFAQLSLIAIGFCSILFGLGNDFGLLLLERFRVERRAGSDFEGCVRGAIRHMAPGIWWASITTAIGFLTLALSESKGFSQLGAMVAIGVFACATIVMVYLFLFLRRNHQPSETLVGGWTPGLTSRVMPAQGGLVICSSIILLVLMGIALAPIRPIEFDTSPASMEPRGAPAAIALGKIMDAFPAAFEPVFVVGEFSSADDAAVASRELDEHLANLRAGGVIESVATATPLLISRQNRQTNAARLDDESVRTAKRAWEDSVTAAGFRLEAFPDANAQWDDLLAIANGAAPAANWSDVLPPSSPWWFLLDRMIADNGLATIAILKTSPDYVGPENSERLEAAILSGGGNWMVTGWSQTLGSLVPWAERELLTLGSAVAGAILLILVIVYRDWRLWIVHAAGLVFALGATVATLKLTGQKINLLNVLAFPLLLAVGVDYGIHLLLALKEEKASLAAVIKPVTISGLSTAVGFGSLALASNPSLSGLGTVCAIGVLWSLAVSLFFVLPVAIWVSRLASSERGR